MQSFERRLPAETSQEELLAAHIAEVKAVDKRNGVRRSFASTEAITLWMERLINPAEDR